MATVPGAPSTVGNLSNERLEFLGDAVLGWMIADIAYRGTRTCPRASSPTCARAWSTRRHSPRWRAAIDLGPCLLLGKGRSRRGAAQAVDPERRARGGHRRGVPRRRRGRRASAHRPGCSPVRSSRRRSSSTGSTSRPCCRSSRPAVRRGARVRPAARGPRPPEDASPRPSWWPDDRWARASGRSKKVAEQAAAMRRPRACSAPSPPDGAVAEPNDDDDPDARAARGRDRPARARRAPRGPHDRAASRWAASAPCGARRARP
jgi:hypothetical protein